MNDFLLRLWNDEEGAETVEWIFIVIIIIAVAVVAYATNLQQAIINTINKLSSKLGGYTLS